MTAAVGQVIRQLLLLCYYNYLIRRAVNIISVFLKRHASKLIHLEALYHQSLLHRSHTPYKAPSHRIQGNFSFRTPLSKGLFHSRDTKVGHNQDTFLFWGNWYIFWVPKSSFIFYSGDTLALKRYMVCN